MSKKMKAFIIAISSIFILTMAIGGVAVSGIARADDSQGTSGTERPHKGPGASFDMLSEILGLTADEIKAELKEGKTIIEIAAEQGISEEELQQAIYDAMAEKLAQKVADGSITQEQADKMLERIQDGKFLAGPPAGTKGGPRVGPGPSFDTLSEILGLTADEIKAQLKEGKTITEIAAGQGLSEEELQEALYAATAEKLAQKVADGSITQEQADKLLERAKDGKMFFGPPHGKGMKGHAPCDSQGDTSQSTSTQQTY